jgi:hypothetical protein
MTSPHRTWFFNELSPPQIPSYFWRDVTGQILPDSGQDEQAF